MTVYQLNNNIIAQLQKVTDADEARAMARVIFEDVLGMPPVKVVLNRDVVLEPETVERVNGIVERVVAGEPLQYVLGSARFMGMTFKVTPATLIPRPETAELVDMIVKDCGRRDNLRVLDVGTGSGCIAISLARALSYPEVKAIDISDEALAVARENAQSLKVGIDFRHADALTLSTDEKGIFDIIVSNPPYVADSEAAHMLPRVLDYEPHSALFVPDSDPLRFYRAISEFAVKSLTDDGALYFEINPLFANDMRSMLSAQGWREIDIIRDFRGKERFAVCRK